MDVVPGGEASPPFTGSATSVAYEPLQAGEYRFRAEFVPNNQSLYDATSHTNLITECFTAGQNTPSTSPRAASDDSNVLDDANLPNSTTVYDTATLATVNATPAAP